MRAKDASLAAFSQACTVAPDVLESFLAGVEVPDQGAAVARLVPVLAEGLELPESAVTTYQIFIARDFDDDEYEDLLKQVVRKPPLGVEVLPLPNQGELWGTIEDRLRQADRVLAIVDEQNANVAYEVGFALGIGTPVALAVKDPACVSARWGAKFAFQNYLRAACPEIDDLRGVITGEAEEVVAAELGSRGEVLALCPGDGYASAYRERLRDCREDWQARKVGGREVTDIGAFLDGLSSVVWVVLPVKDPSERDGEENTANAVIAGFAAARNLDLHVVERQLPKSRKLADLGARAIEFADIDDFEQKLPEVAAAPPPAPASPRAATITADEALAAFRSRVRSDHGALKGIFRGHGIEEVVPVSIGSWSGEPGDREGRENAFLKGSAGSVAAPSLRALLTAVTESRPPHFVLLGAPGAGKTTSLRRLAYDLAQEPSGPIGIFLHARCFVESAKPFEMAAADLEASVASEVAAAFREEVDRLAAQTDRVWLFIDGWDEVHHHRDRAADHLRSLVAAAGRTRIVIASREAGFVRDAFGPGFDVYELQALGPDAQQALLRFHLGDRASAVWSKIQGIPLLAEMAGSPLVLALLAEIVRQDRPLPERRTELYDQAIEAFLRRSYADDEPERLREPSQARKLLARLALALHQTEEGSWTRDEVVEALEGLRDSSKSAEQIRNLLSAWTGPEAFLTDVARCTSLLAPAGDDRQPWSFLHRSFREYLAAEALQQSEVDELNALLDAYQKEDDDDKREAWTAQWGEVFAFLVGCQTSARDQEEMLSLLATAGAGLALRALPDAHHLGLSEVLARFFTLEGRDGDALVPLVASRMTTAGAEALAEKILAWVAESGDRGPSDLDDAAYLLYALESIATGTPEAREEMRASFFARLSRFATATPPDIVALPVPPNGESLEFLMGSPEGRGDDDERPQHPVRLSAFRLGRTTVSWQEFHALVQDRKAPGSQTPDHPATSLSWWEAWLFCRWVGGDLPTEAQWEAACRAGTQGPWSCDEEELPRHAWFDQEWGRNPCPVGELAPNPWDFHDLHGNVREWCRDWFGPYRREPGPDPAGPDGGSRRVLRGGGFWSGADGCRSAHRYWGGAWDRSVSVGFRVAFPAAPSLASSLDH